MRRILKSALWVVILVTTFGSCVKNDIEPYDPVEVYKRNFKAYIGGEVNRSQTWGFGNRSAAKSRAADEAKLEMSEDYTDQFEKEDMEGIMQYFPEGAECTSKDYLSYEFLENATFSRVHLIYTNTSANDEIGFYYYDPETETFENKTEVKMTDDIQNGLDYYFKFNKNATGTNWRSPSPTDGYSLWTEKNAVRIMCRTFTITMNGSYHFGFYVRNKTTNKTYYSNKYLNENEETAGGLVDGPGDLKNSYVFGLSDDGRPGSEILLAMPKRGEGGLYPTPVKPAKPEPSQWIRIICEDLNVHDLGDGGSTDDTDFDFNDLVIDVALTRAGASCILQAAGATLKIRINGDDELEVHKLFGVAQNIMVNTDAEKHGMAGAKKDPVRFDITGSFSSIDKIKIEVYKNNEWIELTAPQGDAASKIAVGIDFEWTYERQSLKSKYPDFPKYATDNVDIDTWWKEMNK